MAVKALATAFVNIVPGTQDFVATIKREIADKMPEIGKESGVSLGKALADGLDLSFDNVRKAGTRLTLGVTTPLAAVGAMSIKTAADFEVSMASLQVNAGASATEMGKLSDLALQMGRDTVFSAGEAANAMLELSKGGMDTATISGGALQATMALAATEGIGLAEASKIVIQTMNQFGLEAGAAGMAVDVLAAGAVASTAGVYDLADGMKYVGTTANMLGYNINDTVTALAAMNNAGIDSTTAGTSFNRMLMGLIPRTDEAAQAMSDMGLSFVNADGSMKPMREVVGLLEEKFGGMGEAARAATLKTIFGLEGMRAANIILEEGVAGWDSLSSAVDRQGIAGELAGARMGGLAGAIEQMKGSIDTAFISIGDKLSPSVQTLTGHITNLVNWFASLSPQIQSSIVTFGVVAAAIGPLLIAIGMIGNAITSIITTFSTLKSIMVAYEVATKIATIAQIIWNAALTANPIGIIIVAIAALVGAIIWFFTQTELGQTIWQGFVEALGTAWNWLWENALKPVFDFISNAFTALYEGFIQPFVSNFWLAVGILAAAFTWFWEDVLKPGLENLGRNFVALYEQFIKPAFEAIGAIFNWIWLNFIKPRIDAIVALIQFLGSVFVWLYENVLKPVAQGFGEIFTWIYANIIKPTIDKIVEAVTWVGGVFRTIFEGVSNFMRDIFQAIFNYVKGPVNGIIDVLNNMIGGLNKIKIDIPDWVPEWGGKSIGFNIAKIPKLAKGGYVDQPTTALIGEAGPEVVTPLKDFERMMGIGQDGQKVLNYYAAPNTSLDSEQALFDSMRRAKVVAGW